jgi:transglutaminase-like putative cysteine protease
MLILFLIFPRISPLWSIQYHNSVAKTGLSDGMEPGNISQLTRSDSVAFRVSFSTGVPPASTERYWRAMTYPVFDGQRWSMTQESINKGANKSSNKEGKGLVEYQVIAEPSANPWLFALDYSSGLSSAEILQFSDGTFKAGSPIYERLFYRAKADLTGAYDGSPLLNRARYLSVPKSGNPMTRAMVTKWLAAGLSQEQIISALLQRFNETFSYTLSPQKLSGDRIDQFLFTTQEGFCEHFSNATAFSLRLAGIPTRVVAGYLGGEWNPYEKYMLVRQYEAHAWVEAWLEGKGWVRIDPTAAVAPERVTLPFDQLFADSPEFMSENIFATYRIQKNFPWLKTWRLRYDAVNYNWHRWVLGYHDEQNNLLEDFFGKITILKMLLLLFIPVGVALTVVIWMLLRTPSREVDVIDREVVALSMGISVVSASLQRERGETVSNYSQRVAGSVPTLRSGLEAWCALYQQVRYMPSSYQAEQNLALFLSCSRQLRMDIKRLKKQNIVRGSVE